MTIQERGAVDEWLSIPVAARQLGTTTYLVRREICRGVLAARQHGGRILVAAESVAALKAERSLNPLTDGTQ